MGFYARRMARVNGASSDDPLLDPRAFYSRAAASQRATQRMFDPNDSMQVGFDQAAMSTETQRNRAEAALRALEASGVTSGAEYERLAAIAQTGEEPKGNLLTKLLGWLDKPAALIRYGIADIMGWDTKEGKEIDAGDAWNIIMGRRATLQRHLGSELVGEDARLSGSKMLEHVGYDQTSGFGPKFLRGLASFGTEAVLDPLTYMTFGASAAPAMTRATEAAATAARMTMEAAEVAAGRVARESVEVGVRNLADDIGNRTATWLSRLTREAENMLGGAPGLGYLRPTVRARIAEEASAKAIKEAEGALVDRWVPRMLSRDFAHSDVADLMAYSQTPAFLKGGAWLHLNPFGRTRGVMIPGTRGLGKKISRTVFGSASSVKGQAATGARKYLETAFAPWYRAFEEGFKRQEYRSYLRGMMSGSIKSPSLMLDMISRFLPRVKEELGWEGTIATLHQGAISVQEAVAKAGLGEDMTVRLLDALPSSVFEKVTAHVATTGLTEDAAILALVRRVADQTVGGVADEAVVKSMADFVVTTRQTLTKYEGWMHEFGLLEDGQGLTDYWMHVVNPNAQGVLTAAVESGVRLENPQGFYEELLNQLIDGTALRYGGLGKAGDTRFANPRTMGATADVIDPNTVGLGAATVLDEGVVLFDPTQLAETAIKKGLAQEGLDPRLGALDSLQAVVTHMRASYMGLDQLQGGMTAALKRLLGENPALRAQFKDADMFFQGSTLGALQTYLSSVSHALIDRRMLMRMNEVGLITELPPRLDLQMFRHRVAAQIGSDPKLLDRIERVRTRLLKQQEVRSEHIADMAAGQAVEDMTAIKSGQTTVHVPAMSVKGRARAKVQGAVDTVEAFRHSRAELVRQQELLQASLTKNKRLTQQEAEQVTAGLLGEQAAVVARAQRDAVDSQLRQELSVLTREFAALNRQRLRLATRLLENYQGGVSNIRTTIARMQGEWRRMMGSQVEVSDRLLVSLDGGGGELGDILLDRMAGKVEAGFAVLDARVARALGQAGDTPTWRKIGDLVERARVAWSQALLTGDASEATDLIARVARLSDAAVFASGQAVKKEMEEVKSLVLMVFREHGVKVPPSWERAVASASAVSDAAFFSTKAGAPWTQVLNRAKYGDALVDDLQQRLALHRFSVDLWLQDESAELMRPLYGLTDAISAHKSLLDWTKRGREHLAFSTPQRQEKFAHYMEDEFGLHVRFTTSRREVNGARRTITTPLLVGPKARKVGMSLADLTRELHTAGLTVERARALLDASRPMVETAEHYGRLGFTDGATSSAILPNGEYAMVVPRAVETAPRVGAGSMDELDRLAVEATRTFREEGGWGGWSYNPYTGKAFGPGDRAIAVGGRVRPVLIPTEQFLANPTVYARQFAEQNRALLEANPHLVVGGWFNDAKTHMELDVAEIVNDPATAWRLMAQRGEKSVFDGVTGKSYALAEHAAPPPVLTAAWRKADESLAGGEASTVEQAVQRLTVDRSEFDHAGGIAFAVRTNADGSLQPTAIAQAARPLAELPPEAVHRMVHMAQQAGGGDQVKFIDVKVVTAEGTKVETISVAARSVELAHPEGALKGLSPDALFTLKGMQEPELALADDCLEMVRSRASMREARAIPTRQSLADAKAAGQQVMTPDEFTEVGLTDWVHAWQRAKANDPRVGERAMPPVNAGGRTLREVKEGASAEFSDATGMAWERAVGKGLVDPEDIPEYLREFDVNGRPYARTGPYQGRFFLSKDGRAGFYVRDDDTIQGVFHARGRAESPSAFDAMIVRAKAEGAASVMVPEGPLAERFAKHGFVTYRRVPHDKRLGLIPASDGDPDMLHMVLNKGAVKEVGGVTEEELLKVRSVLRALGQSGRVHGAQVSRAVLDDPATRKAFRAAMGNHDGDAMFDAIRALADERAQWADLAKGKSAKSAQARAVIEAHARVRQTAARTQRAEETLATALGDARELMGRATTKEAQEQAEGLDALARILVELTQGGRAADGSIGALRALDDAEIMRLAERGKKIAEKQGMGLIADALSKGEIRKSMHQVAPPGTTLFTSIGLRGEGITYKAANPYITTFLTNTVRELTQLNTPAGLREFGSTARSVMNWWKGMATVARPTFHVRNLLGGVWNNKIAGVTLEDYLWVRNKMIRFRSDVDRIGETAARNALDPESREIIGAFFAQGAGESSFARSSWNRLDFGADRSMRQRLNPMSSQGFLVEGGQWGMQSVEDYLRMACFRHHYKRAAAGLVGDARLSAAAAANSWTLAVHFDYKNLTALEKKVKSVVPFFVWTRRNLPLQMRALVERPDLFAKYNHLVHGFNDQGLDGPYDAYPFGPNQPSLLTDTGMVMNADTPMWARFILSPDLPLNDLGNIENVFSPASWINLIAGTLGPQITAPFQAQAQEEMGDVNAPAGLAQIIQMIDWLPGPNPLGHMVGGQAQMSRSLRTLAETALPMMGEFTRPWDTDPSRMQRLGVTEDAGMFDLERLRALGVNFARGFGLKTQTPTDIYSGSFATATDLDKIIEGLRRRGILPPSEVQQRLMDADTNALRASG
jgi:hypothetical protein